MFILKGKIFQNNASKNDQLVACLVHEGDVPS